MPKKSIHQSTDSKQLSFLPQSPSSAYAIETFKENNVEVHVGYTETDIWLTQKQIVMLLGISQQAVSLQINNYKTGNMAESSAYKDFLLTASDGKAYQVEHYNLDVLMHIAFRANPNGENADRVTAFKKWATDIVRRHISDSEKQKLDRRGRDVTAYQVTGHTPGWSNARVSGKEAVKEFNAAAVKYHETKKPDHGRLHGVINREVFDGMITDEIIEYLGLLPKDRSNYRDHLGAFALQALEFAYSTAMLMFEKKKRLLTDNEQREIAKATAQMIVPTMKQFALSSGEDFISGAALDSNGNALIQRNVPLLSRGR